MPRKSGASVTAASEAPLSPTTATNGEGPSVATNPEAQTTPAKASRSSKNDDSLGVDDLLLPRTLTSRLARGTLPPNTSIHKDALLALTKSATVFISYLASTANELTTRKTISPQDVIKALSEIEMAGIMNIGAMGRDGKFAGRLERELEMYETAVKGKRQGYRAKVKARESDVNSSKISGEGEGDETGEPESKRARMDNDDDDSRLPHEQSSSSRPVDAEPALTNGIYSAPHTHPGLTTASAAAPPLLLQTQQLQRQQHDDDDTEEEDEPDDAEDDTAQHEDDDEEDAFDEDDDAGPDDEDGDEEVNRTGGEEVDEDRDPDSYSANAQLRLEAWGGGGGGANSEDEED